jgi:hypothetical protein
VIDRPDEAGGERRGQEDQNEDEGLHCGQDEHAPPLADENLAVQQALKRRVGVLSGIGHLDLSGRRRAVKAGSCSLYDRDPIDTAYSCRWQEGFQPPLASAAGGGRAMARGAMGLVERADIRYVHPIEFRPDDLASPRATRRTDDLLPKSRLLRAGCAIAQPI